MKELKEIEIKGTPPGIQLLQAENMEQWIFLISVLGDETIYRVSARSRNSQGSTPASPYAGSVARCEGHLYRQMALQKLRIELTLLIGRDVRIEIAIRGGIPHLLSTSKLSPDRFIAFPSTFSSIVHLILNPG